MLSSLRRTDAASPDELRLLLHSLLTEIMLDIQCSVYNLTVQSVNILKKRQSMDKNQQNQPEPPSRAPMRSGLLTSALIFRFPSLNGSHALQGLPASWRPSALKSEEAETCAAATGQLPEVIMATAGIKLLTALSTSGTGKMLPMLVVLKSELIRVRGSNGLDHSA